MFRFSPEYMAKERHEVERILRSVIEGMREKQAEMTPEEFSEHLSRIGFDEVAAADFIASDGTLESMTEQMWVYFESPLKPRKLQTA